MTTQTKTNAQEKHPAVRSAVPATTLDDGGADAVPPTALDGQASTGPIAIFYGAAHYPFELARQRELVEDYADAMGLNLVTEFHDREGRQDGLSMLLDACQRGGVAYVITAGWPKQTRCLTSSQPAAPTWSALTPGSPATVSRLPGGTTKRAHGSASSMS